MMEGYLINGVNVEAYIDPICCNFIISSNLDDFDAGRVMHIKAKQLADNVEQAAYERFKRSYEHNKVVK